MFDPLCRRLIHAVDNAHRDCVNCVRSVDNVQILNVVSVDLVSILKYLVAIVKYLMNYFVYEILFHILVIYILNGLSILMEAFK
jgi:hypothetical protein